MAKTKAKQTKRTPDEMDLPEGFEPLTSGKVAGFFIFEEDNQVQGILRDTFTVKGKFGPKNVHKILITSGETRIMTADQGEADASEGMLIGLDETGWLKSLNDVDKGREVFIKCTGKDEPTKEFPRGVWRFKLAIKPLSDDNVPF